MVDQTLVRSELEASRYLPPSAADVDAALKEEKTPLSGARPPTAVRWPNTASAKTI